MTRRNLVLIVLNLIVLTAFFVSLTVIQVLKVAITLEWMIAQQLQMQLEHERAKASICVPHGLDSSIINNDLARKQI